MKKVFLFVVLACAAMVNAQEVIVTTDGQRINAKVTEVSKKEIKYYESDFLDGPLFILETSDVDSILFRNGKAISCRQRRDRERPDKEQVILVLIMAITEVITVTDFSVKATDKKVTLL